jgi:hypothetical protein
MTPPSRPPASLRRLPIRLAVLLSFVLVLAVPSAPAAAQQSVAGRWLIVLGGGAVPDRRGELTLVETAGRLTGTLQLAERDSAPAAITDAWVEPNGALEFLVQLDTPTRFVGRLQRGELSGEAFGGSAEPRHWRGSRLEGVAEFYPNLPRFTVRQIVAGRGDTLVVPGAWAAAAREAGHTPERAVADYERAARAAGLEPLRGDTLATDGHAYLMGGYRRTELAAAVRTSLERIDAQIPDPATRLRFRQLFRSRDGWLVDLHDAALVLTRARFPTASRASAVPALASVGWLPSAEAADSALVPLALYRLVAYADHDSAAFRGLRERMRRLEPASAAMVQALLEGYVGGAGWYRQSMRFFLEAPWLADSAHPRGRSLGDHVRAFWSDSALAAPDVVPHLFGYPQGVPRFGVPDSLAARLVVPENHAARVWLGRHGEGRLFVALRRLENDPPLDATLDFGGETLRLTSVRRQARESMNGFLEAEDAIYLDPSFTPLLALGTLVHEWQHLIFERARWRAGDGARPAELRDGIVVLRGPDPLLAEGFAEWSAERILAPVAERFPLLGVGERAKRARMARVDSGDVHLQGYLLVRALAEVVPERERLLRLAVDASVDARRVLADPAIARRWRSHARTPDRPFGAASRRMLIPEVRFTLEDQYPDILATRIRQLP